MRYRMVFLATQVRGEVVSVQTTDGREIQGVFNSINFEMQTVVLRMAQVPPSAGKPPMLKIKHEIKIKDLVCLITIGTRFQKRAQKNFMTDTQISGAAKGKRRELQRWKPEEDEDDDVAEFVTPSNGGKAWDQFKANEKITGRKGSTFNMNDYSTELDRDSQFYKAHEKEAERLASEIEKKGKGFRRGNIAGVDDDDEEALHSRVLSGKEPEMSPLQKLKMRQKKKHKEQQEAAEAKKAKAASEAAKEKKAGDAPKKEASTSNSKSQPKKEKKTKSKLNPKAKAFIPKFGSNTPVRPAGNPAHHMQPQAQQGYILHQQRQRGTVGYTPVMPAGMQSMQGYRIVNAPVRHVQPQPGMQMQGYAHAANTVGVGMQQAGARGMAINVNNPQMMAQANPQQRAMLQQQPGMQYMHVQMQPGAQFVGNQAHASKGNFGGGMGPMN
uniref:LsmAD domain-containing protein n=1 Tax=Lotharella globosa TaxID=91324 RepID=A0A7S3ZA36_9EUKA